MITRIWDVTLTVTDLKRAIDFYENTLGLSKKYEFKDYAGFDCGGIEIGLKTWGKLEHPREGEPCINFVVDNIRDTYANLKSKGVNFQGEVKEAKWGSNFANFADPDGNMLQITEINWPKYFEVSAPKK